MKNNLAVRDWHWEITKGCNLKCLHCIIGGYRGSQELTTQESLRVISRIVQLGGKNLRITGGEPLMRKDLHLIIEDANTSGLGVDLITNGTMLSDDFLKKCGRSIKHMAISIDGQKQVHEHLRGKGSYERAVRSMRMVLDAGIDLSAYITVHSLNENSLNYLIEDLVSLGIRSFHLNEINSEGRATENQYLLLEKMDTSVRLKHILQQMQKNVETGRVSHDSSCSASPNSVYLTSNGMIYACVEIAFKSPKQNIAYILGQNVDSGIKIFFSNLVVSKKCKCRYSLFSMQGISILLNEPVKCPIIS